MHTNPFDPVCTLRGYTEPDFIQADLFLRVSSILRPRGGGAHGTYINIPMTLRLGCPGGLKGCMVPGDAHPYLVPYREQKHL